MVFAPSKKEYFGVRADKRPFDTTSSEFFEARKSCDFLASHNSKKLTLLRGT
jgi:hypothetical protein